MKLIRFEERLVEFPYGKDFQGYLIVQLDFRDMDDIMLIKSHLDGDLLRHLGLSKMRMEDVNGVPDTLFSPTYFSNW